METCARFDWFPRKCVYIWVSDLRCWFPPSRPLSRSHSCNSKFPVDACRKENNASKDLGDGPTFAYYCHAFSVSVPLLSFFFFFPRLRILWDFWALLLTTNPMTLGDSIKEIFIGHIRGGYFIGRLSLLMFLLLLLPSPGTFYIYAAAPVLVDLSLLEKIKWLHWRARGWFEFFK